MAAEKQPPLLFSKATATATGVSPLLFMPAESPFGDVFKKIERQVRRAKTNIKGRAAAQRVLDVHFGDQAHKVQAASVKTGVVTVDVRSSALFQELEGFHKEALLKEMREAGMAVREIRARLRKQE